MRKLIALLILATVALPVVAENPTFTVDAGRIEGKVSPILYGLMTEEINHSYDGGLYAELIQNRAFLDDATKPVHWSVANTGDSAATIALDPANPLNAELTTSLRLTVTKADKKSPAGAANDGYWGIPVKSRTTYRATVFAKADSDFSGPVTVSIVSDDGKKIYASKQFSGLSGDWKKFEVKLRTGSVSPTTKAHFAITLDQPGTISLGFVSLFPPTWDNQPNGFRKDLMQMLVDLNPKFLRFPGGNYVEGNTIPERFDWKKTIGPVEQRHGHMSPWGYRSTDGMGLLEFLNWCEDMNAEPVLAVYAGYSLNHTHINPGDDLKPFVQDALDEIEYVIGDTNTTWGAQRAKDGHPAPFPLHYVEIGNEEWFDRSGSYDARFKQFADAIKEKYPQLKTISTIGYDQPEKARVHSVKPDMMDEHYYRSVPEFLKMSTDYTESYDRNGPEVFVGEWAAHETSFVPWDKRSHNEPPTPNFKAALGDAAFMAAMERNSDLVKMQCYAPLLVNVNPGARQWRPDLIGYDAISSYGAPSYYAIQMFSQNVGDDILSTTSSGSEIQGCATRDSKSGGIFVKLVNPTTNAVPLKIEINGMSSLASKAAAIILTANPDDTNSIKDPKKVVPHKKTIHDVKPGFVYKMPADSIVVLKLMPRP
ncbi:MAG TPA: alpha-L-arabinofuranosidase C-terminal domain-containing protein [Verrucomicrobiae bacterium]|nr:alpha-L-arabinofuranosidase C-terminal domain-containing protein [Verrucomicrobiae bacterium]